MLSSQIQADSEAPDLLKSVEVMEDNDAYRKLRHSLTISTSRTKISQALMGPKSESVTEDSIPRKPLR